MFTTGVVLARLTRCRRAGGRLLRVVARAAGKATESLRTLFDDYYYYYYYYYYCYYCCCC
eukprot:8693869-Heterocapsa_arctica.AAC.1